VKTLFLVNPRSGAKRKYDIEALIRENFAAPHEVRQCPRKEDLDPMIDAAEGEGFDVVYAVGGDGTVHEIAKRLIGRPLALGILPIGSGNGFARHIHLSMDPKTCLRGSSQRRIATVDTAAVNGIPFLGTMGIGFDALIADRFAASPVRGFRTYIQVGLREFFRYEAEEYEFIIDGEPLRRRAFTIAIANSSQYGNDARIAPHASITDGKLDVVLVDDVSFLGAARLMPRLMRGTIDRSPRVTTRLGRHIEIRRPAAGPAHLDGEPFTLPAMLTIDVKPASLRVLLPDAAGAI
jgi:YegS/Rv2252/BmrU family lipid kinase